MARHPSVLRSVRRPRGRLRRLITFGLFLVLAQASVADDGAEFERIELENPPAQLVFEPRLREASERIRAQWSTWAAPVAEGIGLERPAPVRVLLLGSGQFRRLSQATVPEWGVGYAGWPAGPIVIDVDRLTRDQKSLRELLVHELSHVYLGQRIADAAPPRWFIEGLAQLQAGEWRLADSWALVRAGATGTLPDLRDPGAFHRGSAEAGLIYLASLAAVTKLDERLEDQGGLRALLDRAANGERFDHAFRSLTGERVESFAASVERELRVHYGWLAMFSDPPSLFGVMTALFLLGAFLNDRRRRRRLREMEAEELSQDIPANPTA